MHAAFTSLTPIDSAARKIAGGLREQPVAAATAIGDLLIALCYVLYLAGA